MPAPNICKEQSCAEKIRRNHYLCREHWEDLQEGTIDECPECGVYKAAQYPLCIACNKKANATLTKKSKQEQRASLAELNIEAIQKYIADHFNLTQKQLTGRRRTQEVVEARHLAMFLVNRLTDSRYTTIGRYFGNRDHSTVIHAVRTIEEKCENDPVFARLVEDLSNTIRRQNVSAQAEDKQKTRRYDIRRADTFAERTALLEDDQKAQDKRQLFHDQQGKCVYCGNEYQYDELEIEHMIPKARGGPDHIRNCQLACGSCNLAKGTKTDIEFRQEHANYLPQKERTPADPPIDPELLKAPAQKRRFWRFRRR